MADGDDEGNLVVMVTISVTIVILIVRTILNIVLVVNIVLIITIIIIIQHCPARCCAPDKPACSWSLDQHAIDQNDA